MFHPLLGSLAEKSLDEIIKESTDLSTKLNQAYRFGNANLAKQIRMVLNSYQAEYQKRMNEIAEKAANDKMLKDKVKIKK
jgi:hypothetical protein